METIKNELYEFFASVPSARHVLYKDTFALICWTHKQGEKVAALKLLPDLFKAVGEELNRDHKTLCRAVTKIIDGNEHDLICAVSTRVEFIKMFPENRPQKP